MCFVSWVFVIDSHCDRLTKKGMFVSPLAAKRGVYRLNSIDMSIDSKSFKSMVENTIKNDQAGQEQPVVAAAELVAEPMSMRREGVITVVLTADNHLGDMVFGQQPRNGGAGTHG